MTIIGPSYFVVVGVISHVCTPKYLCVIVLSVDTNTGNG